MKVWQYSKDELEANGITPNVSDDELNEVEEESESIKTDTETLVCYELGLHKFVHACGLYGQCWPAEPDAYRINSYLKYGLFSRIKVGKRIKRCVYVYLYARIKRKSGIGNFFVPIYVKKVDGELVDIITGITINTVARHDLVNKRYLIDACKRVSQTEVANLIKSLDESQLEDYKKSIEEFNSKVAACYNSYIKQLAIESKMKQEREENEVEAGEFLSNFQRSRGKKI